MTRIDPTDLKGDRALELFEKGLEPPVIAERLGLNRTNISYIIRIAKARRERLQQREAAK
jgi:transcriptional regulator